MSFLNRLFKKSKLRSDVEFSVADHTGNTVLENNTSKINNPSWDEVCDYLNIMFSDEEEFVTLTLDYARFEVRYMQSCRTPNGIAVQLGLEKDNKTTLVEKTCDEKTIMEFFENFYNYGLVEQIETFKPVEFYK